MASKSPSGKGGSKSSHGHSAGAADKGKKAKLVFAVIVFVAVPVWLIYYFDPFEWRKPDPGPPQDAYLEQLPEPERERARKQAEHTQELIDSGVQLPPPRGE